MSAEVELLAAERTNVLTVPLQAVVLGVDGKDHVAVKLAAGVFEWRPVRLGVNNDAFVEIKEGLHADEFVILSPNALLSEEQRQTARKVGKPVTKDSAPR
jgi:hypothetical protein